MGKLCNVIEPAQLVTPIPKRDSEYSKRQTATIKVAIKATAKAASLAKVELEAARNGSHEQHVKAGEQSHKNDGGKSGGSGSSGGGSGGGATSGSRGGNK